MNVLSLFDGISVAKVAFDMENIKIDNYFSSEINKNSIIVSKGNHKDIIYLGDVRSIKGSNLPKIDFIIGGSPCQSVSMANTSSIRSIKEGKSKLFFEYARLLKEIKPKYFLLENVNMSMYNRKIISYQLGVGAITINSSLVSIQNRKRLYWTNIANMIKITQPLDKCRYLYDYYSKYYDDDLILKGKGLNRLKRHRNRMINIISKKTPTLMKSQEKRPTDAIIFKHNNIYRFPTREECEIMQTMPIGYTKFVRDRIAVGLLGDGFTLDVIRHIISYIKKIK